MVYKYGVEVQPLVLLRLTNIPERRFEWRSTSELGMPLVWLEEGLALDFQVPAGSHLELKLVDINQVVLINNETVKLADDYTLMSPKIGKARQKKAAILQIDSQLQLDGKQPYSAVLRRLDMGAPTVRSRPASAAGGYVRPREPEINDNGGEEKILVQPPSVF